MRSRFGGAALVALAVLLLTVTGWAPAFGSSMMRGLSPPLSPPVSCPALDGHGFLNFGHTGRGKAHLVYDGDRINVDFFGTGAGLHEDHFDIFFDFHFPDGVVNVVEHSFGEGFRGPLFDFDSTIEVVDGGSGGWTWSGRANGRGGIAVIREMSGNVCVNGA